MYQDYNGYEQPSMPQTPNYYQRQVSFVEAVKRGLQNYCNFDGRASRSEFWWFQLFILIVSFPFSFLANMFLQFDMETAGIVFQVITYIINLALFLPSLGLQVRRLHDINKSGWFVLLGLVCCVGWIILLVWEIKDSDPVENEYGPVPNIEEC